jgi:hypothetical protein
LGHFCEFGGLCGGQGGAGSIRSELIIVPSSSHPQAIYADGVIIKA